MMKLFYSPTSPYVRKVLAIAYETGQVDRIEMLDCAAHPITRDQSIVAVNPTGKVPALVLDDGTALYDSRVICQYLDGQNSTAEMYPSEGPARWDTLKRESLADGLLDAAILARYEAVARPGEKLWQDWLDGQMEKIGSSIDQMALEVTGKDGIDAGDIACACALGYMDFRFSDHEWRSIYPALADWFAVISERPSMKETLLKG